MKYEYHLIIKEQDGQPIYEALGRNVAKSEKGCFKSVRRNINAGLKEQIEKIEKTEELLNT